MIGTGIYIIKDGNLKRTVMHTATAVAHLRRQSSLEGFHVRYCRHGEWVTVSGIEYLKMKGGTP